MLIYDSTNPYDIPATAEAVAGYVDGAYAWDLNGWARFPGAGKIGISVNPFNLIGDALDVESGDATPAQAPAWVKARLSQGAKQPWVYVNRASQRATEDAMWAAGISASQAAMWIATLDGTQSVPQYRYPIAAVQYANSTIAGGHYDISVLTVYGAASGTLEASDMTPDQEKKIDTLTSYSKSIYEFLFGGTDIEGGANRKGLLEIVKEELDAVKAAVAAIQPGGSAPPEPAEPAEPKTLTLTVTLPAQTVTGTGTLS